MVHALKLFRSVYNVLGTGFILLAIPLAFDVGGAECGLSFTFLLSAFYFVLSLMRLLLRGTLLQPVASAVYYTQYIVIPSLLIMHLSQCPVTSPLLNSLMWPWRAGLDYATGCFTIIEGFCTLIIVQACGRACGALTRRSDKFLLARMVGASILITMDFYLLQRIYAFPDIVGLASATLIGAALTACVSLGLYGMWSRKGNVVEITLLFSYIVYQIYQALTDFQSDTPQIDSRRRPLWSLIIPESPERDPLWPRHLLEEIEMPPVLVANVTQFMTTLAELTPKGLKTMLEFLRAVASSITPSIFMSLAWRMFSYLGALRLVPLIKRQTPRHREQGRTDQPASSRPSRIVMLVYSFSPILIIMVYTHLILQHAGRIVHGAPRDSADAGFDWPRIWTNSREAWQFWGWANVFIVLAFYAIELAMSPADPAPGAPVASVDDVIEMS